MLLLPVFKIPKKNNIFSLLNNYQSNFDIIIITNNNKKIENINLLKSVPKIENINLLKSVPKIEDYILFSSPFYEEPTEEKIKYNRLPRKPKIKSNNIYRFKNKNIRINQPRKY